MTDDQRVALGKAFGHSVEMDADRVADKRRRARAMDIALPRHIGGLPE